MRNFGARGARLAIFAFASFAVSLAQSSAVQGNAAHSLGFHKLSQSALRTTFVAGGATLPALAYEGSTATTGNPAAPVAGSVFGYFKSVLSDNDTIVQYCQTGSSFGKQVYDGLSGATAGVNGPCPVLGTKAGSSNGFGASAPLGLTNPDIVGSDAPLSQSEYSTFLANKAASRGEPVELPEIVGAVSMFYNNPDTGTTQIHLTDAQVCGIVTGSIDNWSQLGFLSRPLTLVYRTDGSGTTFSFSNHLQPVCKTTKISTSQQFFDATGTTCPCVVSTLPEHSLGEPGNVGVSRTIAATPGTIGYAEAANANAARVPSAGINFALVNGYDPIKNLPESAAKLNGLTSVVKDSVVLTAGGAATTSPLSPAAAHAGCLLLVKPSAYANLAGGYPIVAVSYQLYAYKGNGANDTKLRIFAQELTKTGIIYSNQTGTKNVTTVDAATSTVGTGTTGYARLGSSFQTPVKTASNACINT